MSISTLCSLASWRGGKAVHSAPVPLEKLTGGAKRVNKARIVEFVYYAIE